MAKVSGMAVQEALDYLSRSDCGGREVTEIDSVYLLRNTILIVITEDEMDLANLPHMSHHDRSITRRLSVFIRGERHTSLILDTRWEDD